ncbi:MAG TPA: hypothetical protein VK034_29340 [Enhygromyxa sp.]|nr:hypothetical protein [Enhygromyxa sp.]
MIARGRAALLLGSLLALGCDDDVRAPLDLDSIDEPNEDCVAVVHERLDLGEVLHEYVADTPSSTGGWALVTNPDVAEVSGLALVRVPASLDEPETPPIGLGATSLNSARVELRTGTVPGELWILVDWGTSALLRKLAPGLGLVANNPSIGNFPINDGVGCPTRFHRQIVLIEGDPFVLALPDCSDSTALELHLLQLDPDSLQFTTSWLLTFDPCASDPQCGLLGLPYRLAAIRGGESTHSANAERVAVGFTKVRDHGDGITIADVSLLHLWLELEGPKALVITFENVWLSPSDLGAPLLAQDLFSTQLHVRNGGSTLDAGLFRFDLEGQLYIQVTTPQLLPLGGRGRLVQLGTQSAIIDVHDRALEAVPLFDVETWPVWQPRTLLELDDLLDFEPAGVGQLLLRREQAAPQIVQLRCLHPRQ